MTEKPYSRQNPQKPKYIDELGISWSGVPLFGKNVYIVKAASTVEKLDELQSMPGVIDFPNVDDDVLSSLPKARKDKNAELVKILKVDDKVGKVVDLINKSANSEVNHGWDKRLVYCGE